MSGKVIAFPSRTVAARVARALVDGAAFGLRYADPIKAPLVACEIQEDRIAVRLPFASSLIEADDARRFARDLLILANELERKSDK